MPKEEELQKDKVVLSKEQYDSLLTRLVKLEKPDETMLKAKRVTKHTARLRKWYDSVSEKKLQDKLQELELEKDALMVDSSVDPKDKTERVKELNLVIEQAEAELLSAQKSRFVVGLSKVHEVKKIVDGIRESRLVCDIALMEDIEDGKPVTKTISGVDYLNFLNEAERVEVPRLKREVETVEREVGKVMRKDVDYANYKMTERGEVPAYETQEVGINLLELPSGEQVNLKDESLNI